MPMTQQDIQRHYEQEWKRISDQAAAGGSLSYSNPVEDAIVYPAYQELIGDLKIHVDGGSILDVGCGSGRWVRYFLERFKPRRLVGVDVTQASVDLLRQFKPPDNECELRFERVDISTPQLDLGEKFDLINVSNVLFHIPEEELFMRALANLANHLAPDGRIITTEYLPRMTMRTEWMLVRSRYHFEHAIKATGLRIAEIRAFSVFSNDPMGLDGPDHGVRKSFNQVRGLSQTMLKSANDANTRQFIVDFLAEIERSVLAFCRERIADTDMPSQKLVVLVRS
jgi:SAM-dependent methyltransferase